MFDPEGRDFSNVENEDDALAFARKAGHERSKTVEPIDGREPPPPVSPLPTLRRQTLGVGGLHKCRRRLTRVDHADGSALNRIEK